MKIIIWFILVASECFFSPAEGKVDGEISLIETSKELPLHDFQRMDIVLLDYLRSALTLLEGKLKYIKYTRRHYFVGKNALKQNPYRYSSDVIQNFKVTRRFAHDWSGIFAVITSDQFKALDQEYEKKINKYEFPSMDRLRDIVKNYVEFQRSKNISAKDLANGNFIGTKHITKLRSEDCYVIGSHFIYNPQRQYIALEWFNEAMDRFIEERELQDYKESLVVDLAFTLSETGHAKRGIDLAEKTTDTNMINERAIPFLGTLMYLKAKYNNRLITDVKEGTSPEDTSFDKMVIPLSRDLYLADVCMRFSKLSPSYIAKLKCRYTTNGSPQFVLSPLKEEELHLKPKISIYRKFITDGEVDRLINEAHGQMNVARVSVRERSVTKARVAKTFFTRNSEVHFRSLVERIDALTGLSSETAEELQIAYYDAGGWYAAHNDAFPEDYQMANGNRITTVLFYLNDVQVGGETAFIGLDVVAEPEKGSALVWDDLKKNGLIDPYALHGACPVIYGHKWIATRWYHNKGQMLRKPCALNKYD